jgi:hypothetical protein
LKKLFVILVICFIAFPALAEFPAVDPTGRSTNARIVGMGRAFTGLADDPSAIFFNPAGLGLQKSFQFSSMSGKFIEDYNYLSAAAAIPTKYGVFSIGYGSFNIGGALPTVTQEGSNPNDPIYIVDPTQNQISNQNNAYLLSYAVRFPKRLSVGANLKIFSAGLTGGGIANGSANGTEMDLGMLYEVNPALRLGAAAINLLPASMGGKLNFANNYFETYPVKLRVGMGCKILGPENALRTAGNNELLAAFDVESAPRISDRPLLCHAGLEWKPMKMIALRVGLDQSLFDNLNRSTSVVSDVTYGIGLYTGDFRFDYALHQFASFPLNSSYFSFSYVPQVKEKPKVKVTIFEPQDKLITFDQSVKVKGRIDDTDIKQLQINGNRVEFTKKNLFEYDSPLNIGKNKIEINSYEEKGKIGKPVDYKKIRVLRIVTFPDVLVGHFARKQIALTSMLNIVNGYPDGMFKPEGEITRAEMAAILMRAGQPVNHIQRETQSFNDVENDHWAVRYIMAASASGVVEGYPDGSFKPDGKITRAEGLTMITRFSGVNREPYAFQYFADVEPSSWSAQIIAGAEKAGLLEYLKGKPFEPNKVLTRAEAVEILYRTQFIQNLLNKDLLNWESY